MLPQNPVYFIGAGPGDPDLLTLAGAKALRRSKYVLAPAIFEESFSRRLRGKEVESPFQFPHIELTRWVESRLPRGQVSVLMPGDFSSFCPFQSFVAHFGERARVLPGVGAHAVAAAILKRTFDLPGVAHATVLTSPRAHARAGSRVHLKEYAVPGHTLVIYMNDIPLGQLAKELRRGFRADVPIAVLERVSCSDERITVATLDTIEARIGNRDPFGLETHGPEPALALVIAGGALGADEDPSWWDRRYDRIWKPRGIR